MSTEIATINDRQELAPASPLAALVTDTERLKELPIETVERLFELHERHEATEARKTFARAFVALQASVKPVAKSGHNQQTNSNYRLLDDVAAMLRPILVANGFSYSTSSEPADDGMTRFVLRLRHVDGHVEEHAMLAPIDNLGPRGAPTKTALHGMRSPATPTAERTLLEKVFGMVAPGEDDDGNAASIERVTEEQRVELSDLLAQTGSDPSAFVDIYGVRTLADLSAANYKGARMVLQTRIARAKAEAREVVRAPESAFDTHAKFEVQEPGNVEPAADRLNRKMLALRASKGSKDEWVALNSAAIEAGLTFDDRAGLYVEGAKG